MFSTRSLLLVAKASSEDGLRSGVMYRLGCVLFLYGKLVLSPGSEFKLDVSTHLVKKKILRA